MNSVIAPSVRSFFLSPLGSWPGINERTALSLKRLLARPGISELRLIDLLLHIPSHYRDFSLASSLGGVLSGGTASFRVCVGSHHPPGRRVRTPYRVHVHHETGVLTLLFFGSKYLNLSERLPVGEERYISGVLERTPMGYSMTHPEHMVSPQSFWHLHRLEPVYPLTYGLSNRSLIRLMASLLNALRVYEDQFPEWPCEWPFAQESLSFVQALTVLHEPLRQNDTSSSLQEAYSRIDAARKRLMYDESLAHQVALGRYRRQWCTPRHLREPIQGVPDPEGLDMLQGPLPFVLTSGQKEALEAISRDMQSSRRMLRLLHGDVGSGKTIIAFLSAVIAHQRGEQSAFMAPTSVLAFQHYKRLLPLAASYGLRMGVLTGRQTAKEQKAIRQALAQGEVDCIVGTHALFQEKVIFPRLGLAIIDEQHRFGVQQRLALSQKKPDGGGIDVLLTTATPIPRTLTLTLFGDMDVSVLKDMPAGRQKVDTRVLSLNRLDALMDAIGRAMAQGARIYWVCPRIAEHEDQSGDLRHDLTTVEERVRVLSGRFGAHVGCVHGQMSEMEKHESVERFAQGHISILVATTVIEVGVDVPEATIMVVEHAERFGLSQLHQLRGRVGRGTGPATCFLLYRKPLLPTSQARLSIIRETTDGFVIAKKDWHLRGEGDLAGTRQSGVPDFRILDVHTMDEKLMEQTHHEVRNWIQNDQLDDHRLTFLLELFHRHEVVMLREAG